MTLTPRDETLAEELERFRRQSGEIDTIVFLDFKAGTVLCVSSRADHPQEVFDDLCRLASDVFTGLDSQAVQATLATLTEVLAVRRLSRDPGTALCLFFDPETAMDTVCGLTEQAVSRLGL